MAKRATRSYAVPVGMPIGSGAGYLYASDFVVQGSANEFTIVLHDILPVAGFDGVDGTSEILRPLALIKLSPQSAKDLASALNNAISQYEKLYSVNLVTDGTIASGESKEDET